MKKIILFLLFPLLCFSQKKTIESFFQEYNYNCENYSVEDLYEFFGFDIEDDVTPALEAINSFCENGSESNKNEAINEVKQLKELLDSGILTQEEFDKKAAELKKIILGN